MRPRARNPVAARPRRGASLVLFVILVFALMAVAAVTFDLGSAQLTQALMQDAVDTASLEGHRWREFEKYQQPYQRRYEVSPIVSQVFDDDFLVTESDAMNFGAGPVFETNSTATGGLAVGSEPVYDPELRYNRLNYPYGDMVSGEYDASQAHDEPSDYVRSDFTSTLHVDNGASGAFLVRMRRTGVHNELDDVGSKSSKGPGMPLLFGRGSMVHGEDPQTFDPRQQGLTVRATAIGLAQPALSVGIMPEVDGIEVPYQGRPGQPLAPLKDETYFYPGVAPFALLDTFWTTWPPTLPTAIPPTGEGVIVVPDVPGEPPSRLKSEAGDVVGFFVQDLLQVGREVVHGPRPLSITDKRMLVPVYHIVDGVKRVVGFGWADITPVQGTDDEYLVVKHYSTVPVGGTSCSLVWPVDPLTESAWQQIFQANRQLFSNDPYTSAALAPGIAR